MAKFNVDVEVLVTEVKTVTVEANNKEEAEELAWQEGFRINLSPAKNGRTVHVLNVTDKNGKVI